MLAYARLERGRKPQAQDRVTLAALLERVRPRLAQRAAQAGMECDCRAERRRRRTQEFTTDLSVVEQILFNLVDNAAKYAREATDRRIHVEASRNGEWMTVHRARSRPGHRAAAVVAAHAAVRQECAGIGGDGAGVGLGWRCAGGWRGNWAGGWRLRRRTAAGRR